MSCRCIVNQIIQCEQQEIELYQRIACHAPTECLRKIIMGMIEEERHQIRRWQEFLKKCDC